MFCKLGRHVRQQYAGFLALFIALGGVSYAATLPTNSVGTKQIKTGAVKNSDLGTSAVTSAKVKNGTLLSKDFKAGQLVAGAPGTPGATGPQGPQGLKGDTGTVDTSKFYDKAASDGRFLAASGKAADSDLLDGRNSTTFVSQVLTTTTTAVFDSIPAHTCVESFAGVSSNVIGAPVLAVGNFGPKFIVEGTSTTFTPSPMSPFTAGYKVCNISTAAANPPDSTVTLIVLGG